MSKIKLVGSVALLAAMSMAGVVLAQEGGASSADVTAGPVGMKVTLPSKLYGDCEDEGEPAFIASGWMGSAEALEYDDCWKENPHGGASCIKITFSDPKSWGGIVWQSPANNWGDEEGGVDLTGAKHLSFWARGDKGGEMVEFKMGIIAKNKPYWDTAKGNLGKIKLEPTWKQYIIPLEGKNLSRIMTGFVFSVAGRPDPVTFYLDDIVYE
ncbi:MAG TPA: hypothetical protein DCZ95_10880 [Verrucomicrobia bacterium]|nr:MAG: hypothetical protein A2X46_08110 [Lentisphaerae bacterium GWF2_57_35]HBA84588.1 hypothetical protein [Verrucomicrobiota bacterium]